MGLAHRAELSFDCGDATTAHLLEQALSAEANDGPRGSETILRVEGVCLCAQVQAAELATFRAAVNSVVRLADAALRTLDASS